MHSEMEKFYAHSDLCDVFMQSVIKNITSYTLVTCIATDSIDIMF